MGTSISTALRAGFVALVGAGCSGKPENGAPTTGKAEAGLTVPAPSAAAAPKTAPDAGIPQLFRTTEAEKAALLKNVVIDDQMPESTIQRSRESVAAALKAIKAVDPDIVAHLQRDGVQIFVVPNVRDVMLQLGRAPAAASDLLAVTLTPAIVRGANNPRQLAESQGSLVVINAERCQEFATLVGDLSHEGHHVGQVENYPKGTLFDPKTVRSRGQLEVEAYTRGIATLQRIGSHWEAAHTKSPDDNLAIARTVLERELKQHELYLKLYQSSPR